MSGKTRRSSCRAGEVEERPYYFYASEKDDFDNWNETQNREQGYARYGTSRYLQNGYEDYEYEMSRSGRWSYMSDFNSYVWTPYHSQCRLDALCQRPLGVESLLRLRLDLLRHLRLVHPPLRPLALELCGGWYWIPAYHWSPAWVSWFGNDHYYGWCPLSWWNRPVIIINNRWDRNYDYHHGIPHHSRSTIIIRKNELSAANAQRVALSRNGAGSGEQPGHRLPRQRSPANAWRSAKVTVINANGKAVTYKQNGIVSSEKYKISQDAGQVNHGDAVKAAVYKYNPPRDADSKYSPRTTRSQK